MDQNKFSPPNTTPDAGEEQASDDFPRIQSADQLNIEGCLMLVETLVKSAAQEYVCARRDYKKNPFDKDAKRHFEVSRRFFLSEYFFNLTNLDGKAVLERLDQEG